MGLRERAHPFGSIKRPDFDLRASWIYGAFFKLSGVLRGDDRQVGTWDAEVGINGVV